MSCCDQSDNSGYEKDRCFAIVLMVCNCFEAKRREERRRCGFIKFCYYQNKRRGSYLEAESDASKMRKEVNSMNTGLS